MKLLNFDLSTKVKFYFGLFSAVLIVLLIGIYSITKHSQTEISSIYHENVVPSGKLSEAVNLLADSNFRIAAFLAEQLPGTGTNNRLQKNFTSLSEIWTSDTLKAVKADEKNKELVISINNGVSDFERLAGKMGPLLIEDDIDSVAEVFEDEWADLIGELQVPLTELYNAEIENVATTYQQSKVFSDKIGIGVTAFSIGLVLIIALMILNTLSSFSKMKYFLTSLYDSSEEVNKVKNQVVNLSEEGAQLAKDQTDQQEQVGDNLNKIDAALTETLAEINKVNQFSESAIQSSKKGISLLGTLNGNVDRLNHSRERLSEIESIFSAIGEKLTNINDIVFKTQLLSFNASIESARAGQHGKGFSVVAEEVGELSRTTGNLANEISNILKNSEGTVLNITQELREGIEKEGDLVGQCEEALNLIDENFTYITQNIVEIEAACNSQKRDLSQLENSVNIQGQLTSTSREKYQDSLKEAEKLNEEYQALGTKLSQLENSLANINNKKKVA